MKYLFTTILIIISSALFSQEKIMKGFGELRLGMTVKEVNQNFNLDISVNGNSNSLNGTHHPFIRITNNLVLNGVELTFQNGSLVVIKCDYNEQLHNGLSQIYGLENRYSTSEGLLWKYKTNNPKITSVGLFKEEMIIFNSQVDYPLFFKKMNSALWALNEAEGIEGL